MLTTIDDVIASLNELPTNSEKGTRFEELMVSYFALDPTLAAQYTNVSRWIDWPHRGKQVDVGIDLVAQDRDTKEWTAIQCKFYAPTHSLTKSDIDSFFTASGKTWDGVGFTNRIIISTTDKWTSHAEDALEDQTIPVQRIGLPEIAASPIDWVLANPLKPLDVSLTQGKKFAARPHQVTAIEKILAGFTSSDRGQWISACGTGKTFTSLKLAEAMAEDAGGALRVLFLAPSIQLVAQTLREWTAQATMDMRANVVCSDSKASRSAEDITPHDLPLPATTDAATLTGRLTTGKRLAGLNVVLSTYQSLDVVAKAQQAGAPDFDLILCDEAHRTTGVTLSGADESAFVKVHDSTYIRGSKRLYMTATPRMFGEEVTKKADDHDAVLSSMDDESVFGPVFHRLGFGKAVELDLLTDYKVLVLVVSEDQMTGPVQDMVANNDLEIPLDDAAKILGCWNSLAKRSHKDDPNPSFPPGAEPMRRAVGFLENIKSSKRVAEAFEVVVEAAGGFDATSHLAVEAHHVDGTMNALERGEHLKWLKAPVPSGQCRILTNARCLSEGVDVPALDAVMFLSPRNSPVDVVQSVGRVMRKAPGKEYGYIILPVAVPVGVKPEDALKDNKRFKVVWDVLNALRAHDDRFESLVQSINLNGGKDPSGKLIIDTPSTDSDGTSDGKGLQLPLLALDAWRDSIYARIVAKVGTREYWDQWAADVAAMSAAQIARINQILTNSSPEVTATFDAFLSGLRANLNEQVTRDDAISMLSQHLITAPVFDALFSGSEFAAANPVSIGMQSMLNVLENQGLDSETATLKRFYDSVRVRASQVTDAAGRQSVIHDLYEKFFKNAFPKQAEALGIVYTPVQVVDFMLRAADDLSRRHFGQGLTDEGVTILDPFTGTGTFIVRLIESGIITPADLARKYTSELLCNEIMLLAYYIAAVNIEATYESVTGSTDYLPFPGATLTDTFQISEEGDRADTSLIPANSDRITAQLATDITIIVGNPPYSVGQTSANDNNANLAYPTLDARITDTYAKGSTATSKRTLYDSYIRAHRWATDRLGDRGIMAFVSNGGWLDGNTTDGMRLTLQQEFSEIWIFNLRGNQRTAGELSRKEGGKIFGSGSRNTVAITLGVKTPGHTGPATIHYRDIGDYLDRDTKLDILGTATLHDDGWDEIRPNSHGDWLNQRNDTFLTYLPLGDKSVNHVKTVFTLYSLGVATGRDTWCYNFDHARVEHNMSAMIDAYNESLSGEPDLEPTRISWNRNLLTDHARHKTHAYDANHIRTALYRPFTPQHLYFDRAMNAMIYRIPAVYPTPHTPNIGFLIIEPNQRTQFSVLASTLLPDSKTYVDAAQFFPRWTYVPMAKHADDSGMLFDPEQGEVVNGYRRVDNITDAALTQYQAAFGAGVSKDDIFNYVYGVLHSAEYRTRFAADLKKQLPRIPLAAAASDFEAFVAAGTRLMELHTGYEQVAPYPLDEIVTPAAGLDEYELFAVTDKRMRFVSKTDRSTLIFNPYVRLSGIPEVAHEYQLGSRSALEWIIDRYWIKTDKTSQIVNDPNAWSREQGDPRYIVDLVKKVVAVSVETMKIVNALPSLGF